MKRLRSRQMQHAFGMLDVLVVVVVTFVLAGLLLPALMRPGCRKHPRIKCVSNLKNVGLAFRIYATDNNDRFPGQDLASNNTDLASISVTTIYQSLSNELSTPKLLICPVDKKRVEVQSFAQLTPKNISYFASLTASETNLQSILAGDRNVLVAGRPVTGLLPLTTNLQVAWSKEIHVEQGNICMGDGSVQQASSKRLVQMVADQNEPTNHLAFP